MLCGRVAQVLCLLDEHYPYEDSSYLNYTKPYELLIATMLSAQCTDNTVNKVTVSLFKKYRTLEDFADADFAELAFDIKSTGFYRTKAKNIISAASVLRDKYDCELPSSINDLISLRGVGRKTANVVRGHIFNIPAVVVDTHVKRISKKLGRTNNTDPVKIEFDLMSILPKESWIKYNHQVIAFGRSICKALKPKCSQCFFMGNLCIWMKLEKN